MCSIISRFACRISSSLTSTKSSRCSQRICCGSSNGTRVARPSAKVSFSPSSSARACHERKAAGCGLRLHADHLDLGPDRLRDDAGAGGAAAAADGHDDRIDVGPVLDDLERLGSDPGDQERLVAGVHVAVAVLGGEALAVLAGRVEVLSVHDQLGAERPHRSELDRVRILGDADARGDAVEARRIGDRLSMVSRRRRDQPARPLVLGELRDEVDPAANLERPDRLVVLVLHPDLGTEQLVETRVGIERSRPEMRADPPARLEDVGEGDRRPVHALAQSRSFLDAVRKDLYASERTHVRHLLSPEAQCLPQPS